jgi:hypothetical protein
MMLNREDGDISSENPVESLQRADGASLPRLSAATTTPSLNLTARTDVPVTMGCWVWV